ncbi:PQQ-binding-like beta-propeller repeat protein [Glycomyces artemisiae]|uniref:Outer membrane protein assembly factor BamB n=1 Tax=Glycomyces artemisiae TaxID=1076443 RepID=A0A2T0UVR2_9ACTN|nr:PQQ-binding-like beta-propeller repeat protein [Glycomyces artemisiae]PRY62013.1 outer membrane protein assembly factor BamB [Glycomyces artemisiae]
MRRLITISALFAALLFVQAPAGAIDSNLPQATASFNDQVVKVAYNGDTVYSGGLFTRAKQTDGTYADRTYLAAVNSRTGALLPFAPVLNGTVHEVKTGGGYLYVAGKFTEVDGTAMSRIARFSLSTGKLDTAWRPNPSATVYSIEPVGSTVYLGGTFTKVGSLAQPRLAAVDASTGAPIAAFKPEVSEGGVRDVQSGHGRLYVAGVFSMIGGDKKYGKLGAVDPVTGAVDTGFSAKVYVLTREVVVAGDRVYAALDGRGGEIRAFTTTGETLWYQAVDGGMQTVAVWGNTVIGGGHFDEACNTNHAGPLGQCVDGIKAHRGKLLAVDMNGNLLPWNPGANGVVGAWDATVHPSGANMTVGGSFTTFGGGAMEQKRIAVFN